MTNYFELYHLPVSFHPDQAAVKSKYYELSRLHHPDRFAAAGGDAMANALRDAAYNNAAYKTLRDADATMAYVLKLHGMLEEEEKYTLPPAFLMEMMDLNEAVSDMEDMPGNENTRATAQNSLAEQLQQWDATTAPLTHRYDAGEHDNALLAQIKDMYMRKKYLLRIQERIDTFATR
ncbi:Fe-S protein assembly co-chaperone HscB [Nemorincola caseinilytica]|uniref:Fe-S protein assembly co-chaperone HscB n=1 Tax=Nemorincola caseinilytica TaxID=2054315 RepID=A0ABP8NNN2_9BACT